MNDNENFTLNLSYSVIVLEIQYELAKDTFHPVISE